MNADQREAGATPRDAEGASQMSCSSFRTEGTRILIPAGTSAMHHLRTAVLRPIGLFPGEPKSRISATEPIALPRLARLRR